MQTLDRLRGELEDLEQAEDRVKKITLELEKLESQIFRAGRAVGKCRRNVAALLSESVSQEIQDLKNGGCLSTS